MASGHSAARLEWSAAPAVLSVMQLRASSRLLAANAN